ncbi:MAG: hypothetical protein KGS72_14030 [Cyanobacteria bacterium REEB67]|nr:hypothetical protein [Cyanobacteria bacterium REEB67]
MFLVAHGAESPEFILLQRDLANNDNDWQLKKLQHDSLKTAERVVEVLRETIEKEVLAQGKDYERLFGNKSAQFVEYLTMVAQKLELHGVIHEDVINWLNSAANEGSVPTDYASDLRDSQSKTVPFIPGGPMHDFGEQSLLDKSLGNMGVSSARPSAPMPPSIVSALSSQADDYSGPGEKGKGNGNTNGQALPGQNAQPAGYPVQSFAYSMQVQGPDQGPNQGPDQGQNHGQNQVPMPRPANQSQPGGIPQPSPFAQHISAAQPAQNPPGVGGGAISPQGTNQPQAQPSAQFAQPAFGQPGPALPTAPTPFGQPAFNPQANQAPLPQQTVASAAQPAPSANLAVTTSQPLPAPLGSQSTPVARREDRKDDDKYVFDPFTAWD